MLNIEDILSGKVKFIKNRKDYISYGFNRSAIWGKFYPVSDNLPAGMPGNWYLLFHFSMIDNVDVYLPDQTGNYKKVETGNRQHFRDRVFKHRKLIVPFKAAKTPYPVYFRLQSGEDTVDIQVSVTSYQGLLKNIESETFIFSIILGIVLLIIIYTLVFYIITRDRVYVLYLLYVSLFWTMQLCIAGYVYQYIFPENYELVRWTRNIAGNFSAGFGIFFCIEFLKLRVNFPRYARLLSVLAILFLVNGSLIQAISFAWHIYIFLASLLLLSIGLIISGIISYRYYTYARYYLVAWSIFLVILLVYSLRQFNFYLPYFSTNSLIYGSCLEMLFLSFALGKRVQVLRDEREELEILALKNEYHLQSLEMKNLALEKDLDLAREVQKRLIPDLSKYTIFSSVYLPMEKVGGDIFDILDLSENKKGILFCDVTGHGYPAAIVTTLIKCTVSNELKRYHATLDTSPDVSQKTSTWLADPLETFRHLNDVLNSYSGVQYLSAVYGILDVPARTFTFISANHPPLLYFTPGDNKVDHLEFVSSSPQMPLLGIFPPKEFLKYRPGIRTLNLKDRSRLVLFSDGFLDTIHYDFKNFKSGLGSFQGNPLYDIFKSGLSMSNMEFQQSLFGYIRESLEFKLPSDDICILSIQV